MTRMNATRMQGWLAFLAILGFLALGGVLSSALGYPQVAGSACRSRCFGAMFTHSGWLVAGHGGPAGYLLLLWLWVQPAAILAMLVVGVGLRRRRP